MISNRPKDIPIDRPSEEDVTLKTIVFGSSRESYYPNTKQATDLLGCPNLRDIKDRYREGEKNALVLDSFTRTLRNASDKVWILDTYLHKNFSKNDVFESILKSILINKSIIDVRFYLKSKTNEEEIKEIVKFYNDLIREDRSNSRATTIALKFYDDLNYLHDRFAVVDNDLWHFGSDVGATLPSLHATSYGWNAKKLKITDFFEELWQEGK